MEYESMEYEGDYWQGAMVITDKVTGSCGSVCLVDHKGRNITLRDFKSCIKTHGLERALSTYAKLVDNWQ